MTAPPATDPTRYLRASEVAAILKVSPKTVGRWAKNGLLPCILTEGGHHRLPEDQILHLARQLGIPDPGASGYAWLSASEAAEQLQVGSKTLGRWAREGKIPAAKTLGGHHLFDPVVVAYLRDKLTQPVTNPPRFGSGGEVRS